MFTVVLVEPETEGNVGAVARVMSNFGFDKLEIVNPKCDIFGKQSIDRAKHAVNILRSAKIVSWGEVLKHDTVVATTAQLGRDYNVCRVPLTPETLGKTAKGDVAIVFGREGHGLSNDEVRECSFVVVIPSSIEQGVMNLSHAVAIILYELFKHSDKRKRGEGYRLASSEDKAQIMKLLEKKLLSMNFVTEQKRDTQRKVWQRILGKSFMTRREAFAIMGFLKK